MKNELPESSSAATAKDSGYSGGSNLHENDLHGEVEVPPEPDDVVAVYASSESSPEQVAPTSEQSPQRPATNSRSDTADSNVSSTPSKQRRHNDDEPSSASTDARAKLGNDNVDSTCEEPVTGVSSNSNGTVKENNEVSSTYGTYEESPPDYQVELKCAVSSCSTFDSFTTPESRKIVSGSQETPVSESSEVVSSQDINRSLVTDSECFISFTLTLDFELPNYSQSQVRQMMKKKEERELTQRQV